MYQYLTKKGVQYKNPFCENKTDLIKFYRDIMQ